MKAAFFSSRPLRPCVLRRLCSVSHWDMALLRSIHYTQVVCVCFFLAGLSPDGSCRRRLRSELNRYYTTLPRIPIIFYLVNAPNKKRNLSNLTGIFWHLWVPNQRSIRYYHYWRAISANSRWPRTHYKRGQKHIESRCLYKLVVLQVELNPSSQINR